jgi:hypothetical protein
MSESLKVMNRIKAVLAEKGLKQTWLAELLGKAYHTNKYRQRNRPCQPASFESY